VESGGQFSLPCSACACPNGYRAVDRPEGVEMFDGLAVQDSSCIVVRISIYHNNIMADAAPPVKTVFHLSSPAPKRPYALTTTWTLCSGAQHQIREQMIKPPRVLTYTVRMPPDFSSA